MSFQQVSLFGGALTADLPSDFIDVSNLRQVPDSQEVYVERDGFTSIIFDILERVSTEKTNDEGALRVHLNEVVESEEGLKIWSESATTLPKLPTGIPAYTVFATHRPNQGLTSTGILLTLVRLEEKETDLVITINIPQVENSSLENDQNEGKLELAAGKLGDLLDAAFACRERILASFDIKDWTLFTPE